ncbi:uncharacterized protein LOC118436373 [Folsomia candida]|nr:uncharacterized protein LOC118436373 [Folsomia candida]
MKVFLLVGIAVDIAVLYFDIFPNQNDHEGGLQEMVEMAEIIWRTKPPIGTKKLKFLGQPSGIQAYIIITLIFRIYITLITQITHLLIFIASVAVYEIVNETVKNVEKLTYSKDKIMQLVRMKEQIGVVNEINGPMMVAVFIDMLGHLATALGKPSDDIWYDGIFFLIKYSINFAILVIAAEAHCKAVMLEKSIIFSYVMKESDRSEANKNHQGLWEGKVAKQVQAMQALLRTSPGQNGLTGWKFFLISYPFLGSALSICLTYAMVMLQFVAAPKREKTG